MEFVDFHKWVYRELGINLLAYKPEQLNRRINSLMQRNGISSLEEYKTVIKNDSEQRQKFLDFITINVTEFFRNPEIFDCLEESIKKELLTKSKNLKVWSAACSIGCEPYSLAIMLNRINRNGINTIIATDIDNTILAKAKIGEYTNAEIKNVKSDELDKFFEKRDDKYYIDDSIKSMVTFRKHDLILDSYDSNFDLILCRNVVIYFNNDVKEKIYMKFAESLKPGGLLFVGATESIYKYKEFGFDKLSTFIYQKV